MIFHPVLSIALIVLMGAGALIATLFLWGLWLHDGSRSWLLRALARASTAMTLGGWYLGWIAYIRITQGLAGVPEWTSSLTTLTVLVMGGIPIYLATSFVRNSGYRR